MILDTCIWIYAYSYFVLFCSCSKDRIQFKIQKPSCNCPSISNCKIRVQLLSLSSSETWVQLLSLSSSDTWVQLLSLSSSKTWALTDCLHSQVAMGSISKAVMGSKECEWDLWETTVLGGHQLEATYNTLQNLKLQQTFPAS